MHFARALPPLLLVLVMFSAACVEDKDYGQANTLRPEVNRNSNINVNNEPAEDSTVKLESLINLPVEAEENDFRIEDVKPAKGSDERVPGPTDRILTVVMRFSDEKAAELVELVEKDKAPFEAGVIPEPWFPAELKAKAESEGDQEIKGKAYSAKAFSKSPWLNGSIVRIPQTNFFVLRMSSS